MSAESVADPDAWAGDRVARWLRQVEGLDRQLAPASDVLFDAAGLVAGERVLDVGCGNGPTTRRAAAEVGADGSVVGLDIAAEMLEAAATINAAPGSASIEWVEADVMTWSPPDDPFDVVLSRFGVMFFDDPTSAFSNLARATRSGGRLVTAVWATRDESELFGLPMWAAADTLRDRGHDVKLPPADGGPFSLGSADVVAATLDGTGWSDVTWTTHDLRLPFNGGVGPEEAARGCLDFGPTRKLLDKYDDSAQEAAVAAIASRFADHLDDNGHVVLGGRVGIVTATRP